MECWLIKCDEPGCSASVEGRGATDDAAIRQATEVARAVGWSVRVNSGLHSRDACPMHRSNR
jgi:hypothetical protein